MWVDELTAIMCDPDKRSTLMAFAKPPFRAYALTRFVEGGGLLEGNVADCFVAAIRQCTDAELTAKCLQSVLVSQPHLALRDDVSGLLTPHNVGERVARSCTESNRETASSHQCATDILCVFHRHACQEAKGSR